MNDKATLKQLARLLAQIAFKQLKQSVVESQPSKIEKKAA